MAYDRQQDTDAPCEGHSHVGADERERADWSVVKILAIFVAFIAFGFWFYLKDKEMVSSDGTVQTTGSRPAYIPDANENRPVTPPDTNEIRATPPRAPARPSQQ